MIERLGNVIYWLACVLTVPCLLWAVGNVWVWLSGSTEPVQNQIHAIMATGAAAAIWATGRAIRYILAAK